MRYRTLLLFVLTFASAVGAALAGAFYDNLLVAFLFIAFPIFSALMFTSIAFDIINPRPAEMHAQPAPQPKKATARPVITPHPRPV